MSTIARTARGILARAVATVGTAMLAACSFEPDPVVPAPVQRLPADYAQAELGGRYEPLGWWRSYEDPVLDRLIARTLEGNLDLQEAIARVEQARARLRVERAGLFPDLSLEAEASRRERAEGVGDGRGDAAGSSQSGSPPGGTGGAAAGRTTQTDAARVSGDSYAVGPLLSYELDFWGRVRNAGRAAEARLGAAVGDVQTTLLSVVAETVRAYFDVVMLEQRLDLARRNVDILRERARLTEQRYLRGLVDSFELYAILGDLRARSAGLPELENRIHAAKARLAVLQGSYPERVDELLADRGRLAVRLSAGSVPPGLPSALLVQRPDVRAAWLRLQAQRFAVGARRAALFPEFTLSARGVVAAGSPAALDLADWQANLLAGLTAPLFQGGRLRGEVEAAEAGLAAEAAAYARAVVTAFREVESAFQEHETALERLRLLRRQVETGRASADLQLRRFRQGVGDYLAFLDARRNLLEARIAVVEAERDLAEARLSVHRALGGTWVEADMTPRGRWLVEAALGGGAGAGRAAAADGADG